MMHIKKSPVSIERLEEAFIYDEKTGNLSWKKCQYPSWVGKKAGWLNNGYLKIRIDGQTIQAHRAVWAIYFRCWPTLRMDHINGNKTDNRICNLREVSAKQNMQNRIVGKHNLTGIKGVTFRKDRKAYIPRIRVDGKLKYLGYFKDSLDAMNAYTDAAEKYFGEYSVHISRKSIVA